jgi:hypothetical protein
MGPGRTEGLGPTVAAVAAAVVVAVAVLAMVSIGGGIDRSLMAPSHVAVAQGAQQHRG